MKKDYPSWSYKTKRLWLRQARKQWVGFRRSIMGGNNSVNTGSAFYPPEVYHWIKKVQSESLKMDKIMREYYKNA